MSTISPCLRYRDPRAAMDWLERTLGATRGELHEDGGDVVHAEAWFGDGCVLFASVAEPGGDRIAFDGGPAWVYVVVDDPRERYERAVAAGADVVRPLEETDYGSRDFSVKDPEGNLWSFGTYRPQAPAG